MVDNKEVVVKSPDVKSTRTTIPFVKDNNLNYSDIFDFIGEPYKYWAGWVLFVIVTIFVVTAVSNGSNLNDGMDGMAAGNSSIMGVAIGVLAYVSSNLMMSDYLNIMFIPGSEEIVVFMCAFVGALIGFLWYNSYPAQIFMGDTGSLTIGGIIAVSAIIIHKELLLPLICGVFLWESMSVILQKLYYKKGRKIGVKQRLWKRTPVHDHYRTSLALVEKNDPGCKVLFKGSSQLYHETKITFRFWIVSIILAVIAILTLKVR
jgi:phospho-N-acetylmuramoyl-pentapeptide-transferase